MHSLIVSYKFSHFSRPLRCSSICKVCAVVRIDPETQFIWDAWQRNHTLIIIPSAYELHVYFECEALFDAEGRKGFRLLFSFHNQSVLPSRLRDGLWNCSVPHWSDFQPHFPCNLQADCLHGEDELVCPYTDVSRCGAGAISLGESCYFYVISKARMTWNDANSMCASNDAYLASLNTPREWDDVMNVLSVREASIYLGLRSAGFHLPF